MYFSNESDLMWMLVFPDGTDGVRGPHVSCPFCQRNYLQGPALTQHVRSCPEKHAAHMVCPLCGYTATCRAQMEQHLVLHNQVHDKVSRVPLTRVRAESK